MKKCSNCKYEFLNEFSYHIGCDKEENEHYNKTPEQCPSYKKSYIWYWTTFGVGFIIFLIIGTKI